MREIPLSRGLTTYVSDRDFVYLTRFNWYALVGQWTVYAVRMASRKEGRRKIILMHVEIAKRKGLNPDSSCNRFIDHKDQNGLNNIRSNLRLATTSQNGQNQKAQKVNKSSRFKGVCWDKNRRKWHAGIKKNGHKINIGRFNTERAAAVAYDVWATRLFGRFASLNFKG